jgi:hypothetical protein
LTRHYTTSNCNIFTQIMAASNPYFSDIPWVGVPFKESIPTTSPDYNDPYVSKIGGEPAWLTENDMHMVYLDLTEKKNLSAEELKKIRYNMVPDRPTKKTLKCKNCGSKLYLVVQAYAPLGAHDRFLYVFGCNSTICSAKNNSWVALRCQFEVDETLSTSAKKEEKKEEENLLKEQTTKRNEFQVKEMEEFSDEEDNVEETEQKTKPEDLDKQLDDLLKIRDDQLSKGETSKKKKKKKNKQKATSISNKPSKSQNTTGSKDKFPCYELDIFEEPEDDLADILTKEQSHELKLFQEYQKKKELLEQTDDVEGSPVLDEYDDDEMEEFSNQMLDRNISGSSGEVYEETRIKDVTQALLRFESILARCPKQSVRWQFGGQPLWCSTIPDRLPPKWPTKSKKPQNNPNSKLQVISRIDDDDEEEDEDEDDGSRKIDVSQYIPKCEHCGASRVFELEIMPTVIFQLDVSNHVINEPNEGMDFGCVTVFTCINQCGGSKDNKLKYVREYVHVQPPI